MVSEVERELRPGWLRTREWHGMGVLFLGNVKGILSLRFCARLKMAGECGTEVCLEKDVLCLPPRIKDDVLALDGPVQLQMARYPR
jgi:hypothetical protein